MSIYLLSCLLGALIFLSFSTYENYPQITNKQNISSTSMTAEMNEQANEGQPDQLQITCHVI
jgi:hypothetical protein